MNIVKELRKAKGIQQKELAISIQVSRPIVSEWESGKKDPSGERLRKLAEYFGVDELTILGKGIATATQNGAPKTRQARIVSGAMDKMPEEERDRILAVFMAMCSNHPELFEEGKEE